MADGDRSRVEESFDYAAFLDRRLALIAQATAAPIAARSLREQARAIVDQVCEGFGVDAAVARLVDGDDLVLLASRGIPGPKLNERMAAYDGIAGQMMKQRRAFNISDVATDPVTAEKYRANPAAFRFRAFCGAPMLIADRVVGILGIYSIEEPDFFTEADLEHLQIVANHVAATIANAQLYEELRRLNTDLEQRVGQRTEELRASEARFRLLAEHAIDVITRHDLEGRFQYVSPAIHAALGYQPEELLNRYPRDFVHPDDRENVISARPELLASRGEMVRRVYRFRHRDGSHRWVESASRYVPNPTSGEIEEIVVVTRDVTDRKLAEDALRESEARYRLLAEHATDVITRHDAKGRYLYVSPASRSIFGYEPEELLGRDPYELFHPDDVTAVGASHEQILKDDRVSVVEYRFRRKDGRYAWLETTSRSVRDTQTDAILELIAVTRDISARVDAEQRLRLIQAAVDQVRESVIITNAEIDMPGPRIVYVNPAFVELTGYQLDEAVGQTPRILQGPKTDRYMLDRLRRSLDAGANFEAETINYRKDGSEYLVEWHISPLRDSQGHIINWVSIQRDITQRRRQEELDRLHREELAHVSRLSTMGEMASGLAHELNQPLAVISNYAHGALQRFDASRFDERMARDVMEKVASQAERAGAIIKRLRAFVTKRPTQRVTADLNQLVQEVMVLIEPDAREHGVRLETQLPSRLPMVRVDVIQIEQVILNLLRNAVEAVSELDSDRRLVTIRTERHGRAGVDLVVSDPGVGMDDEQLAHLFDPFYTTKPEGMGMGLTISHSIVEAHDGRLWASRNEEGPGVSLHLRLPGKPEKP